MIREALIKKLEGDIEVAKTDLRTFLANPIGVAEHIDYVDTAEKKLDKLADAEDKLESLKNLWMSFQYFLYIMFLMTHAR